MSNKFLVFILATLLVFMSQTACAVGGSGFYQYSVDLDNYISKETGKAPTAYIWIPDGCKHVKAVIIAQQNMTEETIFKMQSFRDKMAKLDVALIWIAPAFSQNWDPQSPCQTIFENMMNDIAFQAGHPEIGKAPIIPLGHSAQATFPWNFAAWNPDRTLCIISFHGDAPRTNLCGYGRANVEWGRNRNIDGIPGLMVEGEYEWWEARVNPALAFRMMYPGSCISFLCDTGRGHFDCSERTADYLAKFIQKAMQYRLQSDGTLRKLNPKDGWLAERYRSDLPGTDGEDKGKMPEHTGQRALPAPYKEYKGDPHDAFWYFDREMAEMTEARYKESNGKKRQYVSVEQNGKILPLNPNVQCGMSAEFQPDKDGITIHLKAVYTDSTQLTLTHNHGKAKPRMEVISGPVKKIDDTTFRIYPYEAGWDNARRALSILLVAVADPDGEYRGAVQPVSVKLPKTVIESLTK